MPEATDKNPAEQVRAEYVDTLTQWAAAHEQCTTLDCQGCRAMGEAAADALAAEGKLPTQRQQLPGNGRFRYVTAWQDPEVAR